MLKDWLRKRTIALSDKARQFGLPATTLGTVGGERLRIELTGQGATGAAEERGSRVADALDVALVDLLHAWDHGLARALGIEPSAAESNPNPTAGSPAAGGKAD